MIQNRRIPDYAVVDSISNIYWMFEFEFIAYNHQLVRQQLMAI